MDLKWGIVSAGRISHDFVTAVHSLPGNTVNIVAVAARDEKMAGEFAKVHNIRSVFETYEAMAKSNMIDVAYIGALNHTHYNLAKMFLQNGKHVLCEKPLCLNAKQVASLIDLANKKNLFLMEAVWSRFLPSYIALENEIKTGVLGDVLFVQANFGIPIAKKDRIKKPEFGGGVTLDIGIYTLQFSQYIFKERPVKVTASGSLGPEGTDESVTVILDYSGGRRAVLNIHGKVTFENSATVVGTGGTIKVLSPFHCSEGLETPLGKKEFPFPTPKIKLNFVNSTGLAYQAQEVNRCIEEGLIQSPRMSHAESLLLAELEDEIRRQVGVVFEADSQEY